MATNPDDQRQKYFSYLANSWAHKYRVARARQLPELRSCSRDKFVEWLDDNPKIYEAFHRFAIDALAKGRKRFSAYMIRERVRWYVNVDFEGEFKICNNFTPYIARLLAEELPELAEVFEIHEVAA